MNTEQEFLFSPEASRLNLFPIQHQDIWEMYQLSKASFWVPEEVDLSTDYTDFSGLEQQEQHFLLLVLAFFANSDFIVNENLESSFVSQVQIPELKMLYNYQSMMEDIHSTSYHQTIEALVKDEQQKQQLLHSTLQIDCIKAKAEWARKWIKHGSWVQRLIAFSIVEGLFFSASFCAIFWVKKRGIMKGTCGFNSFISRDEGMHRDVAIMVYNNYIKKSLPTQTVHQMIRDAVEVESNFVNECLPYDLIGMNKKLMNQYVQFVADKLSADLTGESIFNVENPFSWMNLISVEGKTNFFEKRVTEYSRAAVTTSKEENQICFDAEF
jgi:ribonucleoside-diphosphate reductase beta chain